MVLQAGIQAYVSDGIITQDELEKCTPEQLEFLIRKRSPGPGDRVSGRSSAGMASTAPPKQQPQTTNGTKLNGSSSSGNKPNGSSTTNGSKVNGSSRNGSKVNGSSNMS